MQTETKNNPQNPIINPQDFKISYCRTLKEFEDEHGEIISYFPLIISNYTQLAEVQKAVFSCANYSLLTILENENSNLKEAEKEMIFDVMQLLNMARLMLPFPELQGLDKIRELAELNQENE